MLLVRNSQRLTVRAVRGTAAGIAGRGRVHSSSHNPICVARAFAYTKRLGFAGETAHKSHALSERLVAPATMDGCRTWRLRALAAHVRAISPASKAAAAATAPLALTAEQLQRFVIDGYIAVQLADLPPAFHTEAAAMAQRHRDHRTGGQLGVAAAESLDREAKSVLDAVKRSSMAHGAFASLLGPGFAVSPHAGNCRFSDGVDQTFHKDGTTSNLPVRDHFARELLCFYFPNGATVEMGATSVVAGSPYFTVDREGYMQWEDRLLPELADPATMRSRAASAGITELEAWKRAMRASDWRNSWIELPGGGEAPDLVTSSVAADPTDFSAVATRLESAVELLGPEGGLSMRSVVEPRAGASGVVPPWRPCG
eukprot:COSAG06_NODE_1009_length_11087_cov_48.043866_5_plen_370_part_00